MDVEIKVMDIRKQLELNFQLIRIRGHVDDIVDFVYGDAPQQKNET